MAILIGVPSGGVVELQNLDVSKLPVGSLVTDLVNGDLYQLEVSQDAVDHDNVEAVKDQATLRWIKFSGGGGTPIGLPDYEVWAGPDGDDGGDGTEARPFLTLYAATLDVVSKGGGTIHFTNDTQCSPIAGNGLWLRNDGVHVPGFIMLQNCRLRFIGHGSQSSNFVFQRPGAANVLTGLQFNHQKPAIWVVGSEVPIDFERVMIKVDELQGIASPVRLGWDYARRPDFSLESIPVTSAARADRESVFTVDVDSANPWTIETAERDANDLVTLRLTRPYADGNPTMAMSPWVIGSPIRVETSDPSFPSIDATVAGQDDVLNILGYTRIYVQYTQAGATISEQSCTGTVKSHGLTTGDLLMLTSDETEWPTCCQMRVTASTIDTVTVFDPYGYTPRSGTISDTPVTGMSIVKQVRGREVSSAVDFKECSFYGLQTTLDPFISSPVIDLGGTSANLVRLFNCYVTGNAFNWQSPYTPDPENNLDYMRTMVAILANPGAGTVSGASFEAYSCQSQAGAVVWEPQQTEANILVSRWLQDSASNARPVVQAGDGSFFASVRLDGIGQADASVAAITIGFSYDRLKVRIGDVYSANVQAVVSSSPYIGPTNVRSAFWSQVGMASPWATKNETPWPGGASAVHKGINWGQGLLTARYENLFPLLADWDVVGGPTAGITITKDGLAPDGSMTAYKIVNSVFGSNTPFKIGAYPFDSPWDEGDGVIFGAWVKFAEGNTGGRSRFGNLALADYSGGTFFDEVPIIDTQVYVNSPGWQPVMNAARLSASGDFGGLFFIQFTAPYGTSYVWLPTLIRVPVADAMPDDEFYEYGRNLKPQPQYLQTGTAGMQEGGKVIAHGGIGTASSYVVGVGSGQLTIVGSFSPKKYEPVYNADGTVKGWAELVDATVNP